MSERCAFILYAHTRPEKSADFEALFSRYLAASRAEEGCIEYHMLRDAEDPTLFIFLRGLAVPEGFGRSQGAAAYAQFPRTANGFPHA